MPVVYPPFLIDGDPLQRFLASFRESRFFESYLLHFLPYWTMRETYADRLLMVPYERLMADRKNQLSEIVAFLGGRATDDQIHEAARFTSLERMKEHEAQLGHAVSGERYFYGAAKRSHITRAPAIPRQELLALPASAYARQLFAQYDLSKLID
jgi:hypothetical protein